MQSLLHFGNCIWTTLQLSSMQAAATAIGKLWIMSSQIVFTVFSLQVVALATIIGIGAGLSCMERPSVTTRMTRLWNRWTPLIWVPLGVYGQWSSAAATGLLALIVACALDWRWREGRSTYWQIMKRNTGAFCIGGVWCMFYTNQCLTCGIRNLWLLCRQQLRTSLIWYWISKPHAFPYVDIVLHNSTHLIKFTMHRQR